jgi:hypothetical protein
MKVLGKYVAFGNITVHSLVDITKSWYWWIGLLLVLGILGLSFVQPCPTTLQYTIYRLILSLGLFFFVSSISKAFIVFKQNARDLKVGSGVLVFVALYFLIPPSLVADPACNTQQRLKGVVYLGNLPLEGLTVKTNTLSESDITNRSGVFELPFYKDPEVTTVDIQLHYRNLDTAFQIPWPPADTLLRIYLKDTVPKFNLVLAHKLLKSFFETQQKEVAALHQTNLLKHAGRQVNLEEICAPYQRYSDRAKSKRNSVLFENAFEKLNTQKAIIKANIPLEPMAPYHGHYLDNYSLYLYACDSSKATVPQEVYLYYAFLNMNPVQFTIESWNSLSEVEAFAKVQVKENVRYISTEARFTHSVKTRTSSKSKGPEGNIRSVVSTSNYSIAAKKQHLHYLGVRPFQEFVFKYQGGQWNVIGIKE